MSETGGVVGSLEQARKEIEVALRLLDLVKDQASKAGGYLQMGVGEGALLIQSVSLADQAELLMDKVKKYLADIESAETAEMEKANDLDD